MSAQSSALIAAANMRRLRKRLGITQEELGERIGLSSANVSTFESSARGGRVRTFKLDEVDMIAAALGVTPAELITAPAPCACCGDSPPAGMTCQECGESGPAYGAAVHQISGAA